MTTITLTPAVIHALALQWRQCASAALHCLTKESASIVGNIADATDDRELNDADLVRFRELLASKHLEIDNA